jgi:hypothetical protein
VVDVASVNRSETENAPTALGRRRSGRPALVVHTPDIRKRSFEVSKLIRPPAIPAAGCGTARESRFSSSAAARFYDPRLL